MEDICLISALGRLGTEMAEVVRASAQPDLSLPDTVRRSFTEQARLFIERLQEVYPAHELQLSRVDNLVASFCYLPLADAGRKATEIYAGLVEVLKLAEQRATERRDNRLLATPPRRDFLALTAMPPQG